MTLSNMTGDTEDIDGLLTRFFRSEVPKPWPAAPTASGMAIPDAASGSRGGRARLTLAASVAAILVACWAVAGSVGPAVNKTEPDLMRDATAQPPAEIHDPGVIVPMPSYSPSFRRFTASASTLSSPPM
jgi:hypothetical protein